jgi:hypothetical protein
MDFVWATQKKSLYLNSLRNYGCVKVPTTHAKWNVRRILGDLLRPVEHAFTITLLVVIYRNRPGSRVSAYYKVANE